MDPLLDSSSLVSFSAGEGDVQSLISPQVLNQKHKKVPVKVRCKICGEVFSDRKAKFRHEMEAHSSGMVAYCQQCDKGFFSPSGYKFHMRIHESKTGISDSPGCPTCGKFFQSNAHLLRHMRSHSQEKPFLCEKCFKSYKHKKDLLNHKESSGHI